MKIAIIGTGISGLAAAHRLQGRAELTLFEAGPQPGGHVHTVVAESERGLHSVDTGFIVFNERNYPEFTRLLEELEVPSQPSKMSFGISDGKDFEYSTEGPNGLFARRANLVDPRFLSMLRQIFRFHKELGEMVDAGVDGPSLAQFLEDGNYSEYFIERLIVPQVTAVWSAGPEQMWDFPIGFLARFFDNHGMLSLRNRPRWRTVTGGSWQYVEALLEPIADRVRTNCPVERVERFADHVQVTPRGGAPEIFDEVIIATHSDQALAMLADPTDAEREVLGAIAYQPNEAVLHTDESLMPKRRSAWASWNVHLLDEPTGLTSLTYDMNRLQSLDCERQFCVTLNMTDRIDPDKVIEKIDYAHPVFTPETLIAQERWQEISGVGLTHYCGAYWRNGFHEDGAFSGMRVAGQISGEPMLASVEPPPGAPQDAHSSDPEQELAA